MLRFVVSVFVATCLASASNTSHPDEPLICRCLTTNQVCFSGIYLNIFNRSVGGSLFVPRPTAYPCYQASLDQAECTKVQTSFSDPFFRLSKPGSMQAWNHEESDTERCPLETANRTDAKCQPGRVPALGVIASSVSVVQKTVRFAAQNYLRLYIKNTGHDYLARSSSDAAGSLMLWMHPLQTITTNLSFVPFNCSGSPPVPAVTVEAGALWREVYKKVDRDTNGQYVIIGAMCLSVGAAGGYVLGGGHGILGPSFGLSVDNVLQFEIVTADGELKVVNNCTEPDLFWALRGGGGGTFGVVTKVTYRIHPKPPNMTSFYLNVAPNPPGRRLSSGEIQDIFTVVAKHAARLDEARWSGDMSVNAKIGAIIWFLIPADIATANQTAVPLAAAFKDLAKNGSYTVSSRLHVEESFYRWRTDFVWPAGGPNFDVTGGRVYLGSRLISVATLNDPIKLGRNLARSTDVVDTFIGLFTSGRGVRERDRDSQTTSVSPAWREAFMLALYNTGWTYDTSKKDIAAQRRRVNSAIEILDEAYPDFGTYFNEALMEEADWKPTLWGEDNYARLFQVKKNVDPDGLFTCRQCVGSDVWDEEGNCRVR